MNQSAAFPTLMQHSKLLDSKRQPKLGHYESARAGGSLSSIPTSNPINLLKLRRGSGSYQLAYLVRSLRLFQATDPRDKVFSLISIASDATELAVSPDFSKSCSEVYINVAKTFIRKGYLEVLSLCSGVDSEDSQPLPTWVPDLSQRRERACFQQRSMVRKVKPGTSILQSTFSAAGDTKCTCDFIRQDGDPARVILSLEGIDNIGRNRSSRSHLEPRQDRPVAL